MREIRGGVFQGRFHNLLISKNNTFWAPQISRITFQVVKGTLALRPGWRSFHGIGLYTRAGGIWRNCRHGLREGFEERRGSRCIVQYTGYRQEVPAMLMDLSTQAWFLGISTPHGAAIAGALRLLTARLQRVPNTSVSGSSRCLRPPPVDRRHLKSPTPRSV
jgi:hypothetical protein